ncbi:retinol dehydrogenase 12 [Hypoxylon sp. FL1150]|nr:retinol dehydrogenase 12 [Hypoxylon sp. FL1150]
MGQLISQPFPPPPKVTEKNLPDQTGKVFIVTGSTSGVGKALAGILYGANAKVYITGRTSEGISACISDLKNSHPTSNGELACLHLDLADLHSVKSCAEEFLTKETKLNVLFNNAGVMIPPHGSKTVQGYELQLGVNAIGPFLLTQLLTPLLQSTARESPPGDVRVVWLSSSFARFFAPTGGVEVDNLNYKIDKHQWVKYAISKAANTLYSAELARRFGNDGIISVSLDPGNLKTGLRRHAGFLFRFSMKFIEHDPIYGAYTELFGGLSREIALEQNNAWICPWGSIQPLREDIAQACRIPEQGGTGNAVRFWEWTAAQVESYISTPPIVEL